MGRNKKKRVLEGHKRKGARFVPPLMQIENMQEVSYINDALPNLIWMGLLFDRFGYRKGVDLSNRFVTTAYDICKNEKGNFSYLCYYSKLDISKKAAIYRSLKSEGILYPIQDAVAPLSCLFNYFPALFLIPDFQVDKTALVPILKRTLKEAMNRYSTMSTAIQVTTIYNLATNDKLRIASHIKVPDFDSIFTAPDSDEAKRAASFARTNLNGELGYRKDEISQGWVRDFWLQIFRLGDCEFSEVV